MPIVHQVKKGSYFSQNDRTLTVVSTVTPWHEPPRIRHQVTRQLARFYNVLYVQLPFGSQSSRDSFEKINENLVIFAPKRLPRGIGRLWDNVPTFHHIYNNFLARKIESAIGDCGYSSAILVNFQFNFPEIMYSKNFHARVYICNDEFPERARHSWKRRLLSKYENKVISNADLCFAVSQPLFNKLERHGAKVELLLPGHEFKVNQSAQNYARQISEPALEVCFMGYINNRIRYDWLERALEDKRIKLSLIGPVQDPSALGGLKQYRNFELHAPMQGIALQDFLQSKHVLVLPYDTHQISVRASSAPNKLFQYLACGKPVVISDMPNFIKLPKGFIYRASSADEFVTEIYRARYEDSAELELARLHYAAQNTWDSRGEFMYALLENCVRRI